MKKTNKKAPFGNNLGTTGILIFGNKNNRESTLTPETFWWVNQWDKVFFLDSQMAKVSK